MHLHADTPVEAVIATASGLFECFLWSARIISRNRTDFPVPVGLYVRKNKTIWNHTHQHFLCRINCLEVRQVEESVFALG